MTLPGDVIGMMYSMGNPQNGQIIKPRYNQIYVSYVSYVCISFVFAWVEQLRRYGNSYWATATKKVLAVPTFDVKVMAVCFVWRQIVNIPPNICQPWERTLTVGEAKPFAGLLAWFFSDTIFHFCGMGPASRWFCSVSTRYQLQFVLFELFDDWLSGSDGILGPDNLPILV